MFRIIIVLALVAISAMTVHAQSVIVKGQIISEDKQGLPGTGIRSIKDRSIGISADENGAFEIAVDKSDTLVVSYVGFKQKFVPASLAAHNRIIMLEPTVESITTVEVTAE